MDNSIDKVLISQLEKVDKLGNAAKWQRLLNNPVKYLSAIGFRKFVYPKHKHEKVVEATLFFGQKMTVALPAAMDIYLTGGKTHSSEIRLAKFMILNIQVGSHFLDVGAHYGYFTLLAERLVGEKGQIVAFEPTSKSYSLLQANTKAFHHISARQMAVSNTLKDLTFYEFPNLYSEYNTSDVGQFEKEAWFQASKPIPVTVKTTTIDETVRVETFQPQFIKIDVEGAEFEVIQGGIEYFKAHSPIVAMEYLEPKRNNKTHQQALALLLSLGYTANMITDRGGVEPVADVDNYLMSNSLESDNIVFIKRKGN